MPGSPTADSVYYEKTGASTFELKITDTAASIYTMTVANGSVNANSIAPNSVTSAHIVAGAVALVDLAANSVDSSKVVDGSLALADLTTATQNMITGNSSAYILAGAGAFATYVHPGAPTPPLKAGDLLFKTADGTKAVWDGAAWQAMGGAAAGPITALSDVANTMGTAGQVLQVNAGGTAMEFVAPASADWVTTGW